MFCEVLRRVEAELDIPYPQRRQLRDELEGDLCAAYWSFREQGSSDAEAQRRALAELELDPEALSALEVLHNPAIRRILLRLPPPSRERVEWVCASLPLGAVFLYLIVEVPMVDFVREGGMGAWVVLFVGALSLLLLAHRAFVWFVVRDHSVRSLGRNTQTPLYLAIATFALGVMSTALNFYVVLLRWSEGQIPPEVVPIGLKESLSSLILAAGLATVALLVHSGLQAGLRALDVPRAEA